MKTWRIYILNLFKKMKNLSFLKLLTDFFQHKKLFWLPFQKYYERGNFR